MEVPQRDPLIGGMCISFGKPKSGKDTRLPVASLRLPNERDTPPLAYKDGLGFRRLAEVLAWWLGTPDDASERGRATPHETARARRERPSDKLVRYATGAILPLAGEFGRRPNGSLAWRMQSLDDGLAARALETACQAVDVQAWPAPKPFESGKVRFTEALGTGGLLAKALRMQMASFGSRRAPARSMGRTSS